MNPAETLKPLILVVDDLPENIHVLVSILREDYRIKTAINGEVAIKLANHDDRPELILLDVMMPGMSGIEVMRHLRASQGTRDIPVIFASADASEQSQLDGLALGADDYLVKPVISTVLKAKVANLLQRKHAERRLRIAAHVFEYSGEAIMINDKDNCIIEVNPAFTRLTGYGLDEVQGKDPKVLSAGRTDKSIYDELWRGIGEQGFWQGELWDRTKDGRVYPAMLTVSVVRNAHQDIDFYIGSFTDISERKAAEMHINHLATHDTLTGLLNRFGLQSTMQQAVATANRNGRQLAVALIDMDRFKQINDTLGHAAGDTLLVQVAQRLRESVRESDIVARLGGDEFVVVLTDLDDPADAGRVARKILESLGRPYPFDGKDMHSTPSIGIASYPDDGCTCDILMKHADTAMYRAKEFGRNNAQFFTADMASAAAERHQLEQDLRAAITEGALELHFQPQLDARARLTGFEALVRWRSADGEPIPPDRFIPVAEECGLIQPLGAWVMNEACRQLRAWRDLGHADVTLAINLSAHQLHSPSLLVDVVLTLEKHGLKGADLEFEITESVAMSDPEASIGVLQALRIMGIRLAIDDFGTGYSSLSYLKLLPIHSLKLDKSFVRDIESDAGDATICTSTIALAHNLGLIVVAEGVETAAQRDFLAAHGCDVFQGYLFSKPLPAQEALAFMQTHARKERGEAPCG